MAYPRAIRLNNPGNIEHGAPWVGLAEVQDDPRFCTFTDPEYGIRAICRILFTYKRKYGIDTIDGIINRWAPPHENPTSAYVFNVSQWTGIPADQSLDLDDPTVLANVTKAVSRQEAGAVFYEDSVFLAGAELALNA